ncbi:2-oxo acid dehydrogenase subunit E2 [Streptomyces sp. NPDC048568]|uniref:2-oxo acid dehydrogenase subunit E2 n=1 Tax=Streptomyces sp. NPDC048568 TaxID=3365571 RepID=UPI0037155F5B
MAKFTMPSLGADMDEGTLLEWLVGPGDTVRRGDPVAVVETAKSTIEVECFDTGMVAELLVEPGTTVPVGTPLALIGPSEKSPPARHAPSGSRRSEPAAPGGSPDSPAPLGSVPAPATSTPRPPGHTEAGPLARHFAERRGVDLNSLRGSGPGGRVTRADVEHAAADQPGTEPPRARVTPFARRLAAELGVDLATVTGTGRNSAIRSSDVRRAAPGSSRAGPASAVQPAPVASSSATPPSGDRTGAMRQAIADLMSRANRDIPHYYLSTAVDMAAATEWLRAHNRRSPVGERLLPAALLLKAAALGAHEVPALNGFWTEDHFTAGDGVHLGVAVSLRGGGLVAPTLHHADALPLTELMKVLKDLVTRARTGRLRGSEVSDATITVTNLGDQGVESVLGVIHPPQVALVGFGRVVDRPWAVDGLVGVRPVVTATLSADHRATDGAVGSNYLETVARLLQNPEHL